MLPCVISALPPTHTQSPGTAWSLFPSAAVSMEGEVEIARHCCPHSQATWTDSVLCSSLHGWQLLSSILETLSLSCFWYLYSSNPATTPWPSCLPFTCGAAANFFCLKPTPPTAKPETQLLFCLHPPGAPAGQSTPLSVGHMALSSPPLPDPSAHLYFCSSSNSCRNFSLVLD